MSVLEPVKLECFVVVTKWW